VTVVAVNLSPSLLLLLHTRDPLASSSVVPGPMFPVFATGAGGGGGGGAGAGAGVAAGGVAAGAGCEVAGDGAGAGAGSERPGARGAGSLRVGVRWAGAVTCCELDGAGAAAGATAAEGALDFEWKMPSWLRPVTAAVIDPTSAAVAVRYPGAV
jgi:hypothetical protein